MTKEEAIDVLKHNYPSSCYTDLCEAVDIAIQALSIHPERKKGKWDERKVFDTEDSDIAEMQSAKCSACGKYHTTPYLYFFDNFNYCPNCGARMVDDDIS